jgi:hypothetical protein
MRKVVIIAGVVIVIFLMFVSLFFASDKALEFDEKTNEYLFIYAFAFLVLGIHLDFRKPQESHFAPKAIYTRLILITLGTAVIPIIELVKSYYFGEFFWFLEALILAIIIITLSILLGSFDQIKLIRNDPNAFTVIRNSRFITYEMQKGTDWNDIPEQWFILPKSVDTLDAFNLADLTRNYYYGKKDYKTALAIALDLIKNAPICVPKRTTKAIKKDALVMMIMIGEPPARIRACYENIRKDLHSPFGDDGDRAVKNAVLFTYYKLFEKDEIKAEFAKSEFVRFFEKAPRKNRLSVENELIPEIEARAGQPPRAMSRV